MILVNLSQLIAILLQTARNLRVDPIQSQVDSR